MLKIIAIAIILATMVIYTYGMIRFVKIQHDDYKRYKREGSGDEPGPN